MRNKKLVVSGKQIELYKCENTKSGYQVIAADKDSTEGWKILYQEKKDAKESYIRVYLEDNSTTVRKVRGFHDRVYLHQLVYAYYNDWNKTTIKSDEKGYAYEVHHILNNDSIKKNPYAYNHIMNLVYLSKKDHTKLHNLLHSIKKNPSEELWNEYFALINKASNERDARLKKVWGQDGLLKLQDDFLNELSKEEI